MKIKLVSLLVLPFLLSSCKKEKLKKSYNKIRHSAETRVGEFPEWQTSTKIACQVQEDIFELLEEKINLDNALFIALQNNAELQAGFEELGIAHGDLIQAGFYTNPYIDTMIRFPKSEKTNIELDATLFTLSDLWQVPLKKKIAKDLLEIKSLDILNHILTITNETKKAYFNLMFAQTKLIITKQMYQKIKKLRDRIYYRYQFGFVTKLDKYYADIKVSELKNMTIQQHVAVKNARAILKKLLGINFYNINLNIETMNNSNFIFNIDISDLENYAFEHRPELLIASTKIQEAKHTISYEKSRVIENVQVGVSFERDFDGTKGAGPLFGISIPLFNTNYGNIERANYQLRQAKKQLYATKQQTLQEITTLYNHYQGHLKECTIYKKEIIPAAQKAIQFANEQLDTMQMSMVVVLETFIRLYEAQIQFTQLLNQTSHTLADLEKVIGTSIKNL